MTYASQFAAITLEQLQSMRDRCAMRTGVLADPIMLNILDQEIASRGPAVPDYPICDECDERHSVDVSCEDYTERAMQKATATESSTGPIRVFSDRELATVLHALRAFQSDTGYCLQGCDHFDEVEPLTNDEIDVLCERLNLAPESPVEPEGQDDPAHDSEGPDECARCGRNLEDDMTAEQRNGPPCSECGAGQEEITSPAQSVNRTIALAIVDEMQIDLTITPLELAQLSQWSEFQATLKK